MPTNSQQRKLRDDVARVQKYARIVLFVDEKGAPLCSIQRGEAPERHQASLWLDVIAVIGPLWDDKDKCWRECVWWEMGMSKGVPYAETYKPMRDGKRVSARSRILKPTKEQLTTVFPFILHHMEEHARQVMCRWKKTTCSVKSTRVYLNRGGTAFMHTKHKDVIKGVRFRVHKTDIFLCGLLASTSLAKHVDESGRFGRFLSLCLKEELFPQTPEAWKLESVWGREDIYTARTTLEDSPPHLLAGAFLSLLNLQEDEKGFKGNGKRELDWTARVAVILSLLEAVNRNLHIEVMWWMDLLTVHDFMPEIPHFRLVQPTKGRESTLCFELGFTREET